MGTTNLSTSLYLAKGMDYYKEIPESTMNGILVYVIHRQPPGDFLRSVLENNLHKTLSYSDDDNLKNLKKIVLFLVTYLPSDCWGDKNRVQLWLQDNQESDLPRKCLGDVEKDTDCGCCGEGGTARTPTK